LAIPGVRLLSQVLSLAAGGQPRQSAHLLTDVQAIHPQPTGAACPRACRRRLDGSTNRPRVEGQAERLEIRQRAGERLDRRQLSRLLNLAGASMTTFTRRPRGPADYTLCSSSRWFGPSVAILPMFPNLTLRLLGALSTPFIYGEKLPRNRPDL